MEFFDVIVVGAGSAGAPIARRLVDADAKTLVLEAGERDDNPAIHEPSRMHELWHSPQDWDYRTVPQRHAADRRLHLPRGKVLGGSHALNGMVFVRCAPWDYDHWAELGCEGWAWEDVLPYYRAMEDFDGGASELRGAGGPLAVVRDYPLHPIQESVLEAYDEEGIEYNPDYNGERLEGVSVQQITYRDERRLTTYGAYLAPVASSPRLTVRTGSWVHRLLADGDRIIGVEYERDGALERAYADEVVLSAGALDSPRVLLRSGIGPADELRAVGLDVRVDSAGVGRNLQDHLLVPVLYGTRTRDVGPLPTGTGIMQTHSFWRSRPGLPVPDTQPVHFSVPAYEPWMEGPETGFTLMGGLVTPRSRGSVRLSGAEAHDPLLIDPDFLAADEDVAALAASVRQLRGIGARPALARGWGASELYPGPAGDDDAALEEYIRRTVVTYHHQAGTCAMGVDGEAVVDPRLRVRGVEGLRVADASVMPTITTGNTNAPSILIGERAAAFLLSGE